MENTNNELKSTQVSDGNFNWRPLLAYPGVILLNALFSVPMLFGNEPSSETGGLLMSMFYLVLIAAFGYFTAYYPSKKPFIFAILYYSIPVILFSLMVTFDYFTEFDLMMALYFFVLIWLMPPLAGFWHLDYLGGDPVLVAKWLFAPGLFFLAGYMLSRLKQKKLL